MSVQQQIDRINTEVSAQETLLDQALAAIANKAAGGGSSSTGEMCTATFVNNTGGDVDFVHTTATDFDNPYMETNSTLSFKTKKGSIIMFYGEAVSENQHAGFSVEGEMEIVTIQVGEDGVVLVGAYVNGDFTCTMS